MALIELIPLSLLIILPGFVAYSLAYEFIGKRMTDNTYDKILWSLFLSLTIYSSVAIMLFPLNYTTFVNWMNFVFDEKLLVVFALIIPTTLLWAIISAMLIQFDWLGVFRYKFIGNKYTKKAGDVWQETILSFEGYVIVETKDDNKYLGWMQNISTDGEIRDIVLQRYEKGKTTVPIKKVTGGKTIDIDNVINYDIERIFFSQDEIKKIFLLPKS